MKVLVVADACPVTEIVVEETRRRSVPVVLYTDTNHVLRSDYAEVKTIGAGADAVDFALVNSTDAGDIVVTQDYGLAAMVLAKKAYGIGPFGKVYSEANIEDLLTRRAITKDARRKGSHVKLRGAKKRTTADDEAFRSAFVSLLETALNNQ